MKYVSFSCKNSVKAALFESPLKNQNPKPEQTCTNIFAKERSKLVYAKNLFKLANTMECRSGKWKFTANAAELIVGRS